MPVLATVAFLALLWLVVGDWEPLRRADSAVSERFREYGAATPGVVSVTRVVTDLMATLSFLAIGLATVVLLAARRRWRAAGFCAAVAAVVPALWSVLHLALHRPRPLDGFVTVDSNGFPSGHTAHAAATALVAVLLVWPRLVTAAGRAAVLLLGAGFAGLIGLTRVALLAHWPTDVLGGMLLALAVVPALAAAFRPAAPSPAEVSGSAPGPGSPPGRDYADRACPGSG